MIYKFYRIFGDSVEDIKNNYIHIFKTIPVKNKLAAKRIKDELEYFIKDIGGNYTNL